MILNIQGEVFGPRLVFSGCAREQGNDVRMTTEEHMPRLCQA